MTKQPGAIKPVQSQESGSVQATGLISQCQAPALILDANDALEAVNGPGEALARGWRSGVVALLDGVRQARRTGGVHSFAWIEQNPAIERSMDLLAIPLEAGRLLLVGKDLTMERRMAAGLMTARERFSAFLNCAADFGWETDRNGHFTYITPGGAIGLDPDEMVGRPALDIFVPLAEQETPFSTHAPMEVPVLWVLLGGLSSAKAAFRVSARPRFDMHGQWAGARGIALNVTESATQESLKEMEQARQSLMARILLAIRTDVAPHKVLTAACETLKTICMAEGGWLLMNHTQRITGDGLDGSTPLARAGERLVSYCDWTVDADASVEMASGNVLIGRAGSAEGLGGALLLHRSERDGPWRAHEIEIVSQIIAQIGICLKQAALIERLKRLSRIDDLTDLLNRRAFMDKVGRRIAHQHRTGRRGALLYIDLDKFKMVNDTLGHAIGDKVLKRFGQMLRQSIRVGDAAGRLGGDEFALWLEETDADGAQHKARQLLAMVPELRASTGDPQSPLGLSIGIAVSRPDGHEQAKHLADRADQALYTAKQSGRGRYAMAEEAAV